MYILEYIIFLYKFITHRDKEREATVGLYSLYFAVTNKT